MITIPGNMAYYEPPMEPMLERNAQALSEIQDSIDALQSSIWDMEDAGFEAWLIDDAKEELCGLENEYNRIVWGDEDEGLRAEAMMSMYAS